MTFLPPAAPAPDVASAVHGATVPARPRRATALEGVETVVQAILEIGGLDKVSLWRCGDDEAQCLAEARIGGVGSARGRPATSRSLLERAPGAAVALRDEDGGEVALLLTTSSSQATGRGREVVPEHWVERARRAVLDLIGREELDRRANLAAASRAAIRAATTDLSLLGVVQDCRQALEEAFGADEVWIRLDTDEPPEALAAMRGISPLPAAPDDLMRRIQTASWQRQQPIVLTPGQPTSDLLDEDDLVALEQILRGREVGSSLLVPLGCGGECLGRVVMNRSLHAAPWTAAEADDALDVGHDLGRAVLNARTFEREHDLVEQLRALDTYKTQLIATVAHELKTPLTSVVGNLELLEDDPEPHHTTHLLAKAHRGATRLADLVDDLLLLSRVADDDAPHTREPVDLVTIARDVRDLTSPTADHHDQHITLDAPHGPVICHGDRRQLEHVVTNLVTNALKYSPPGRTVTLTCRRTPTHAVLTCTDHGIGITAEDTRHLFREFFRSEDPWTQRQNGTGLGLSIAQRIVQRHHGRLTVASTPGHGSTFTVTLPTTPPDSASAATPTSPAG